MPSQGTARFSVRPPVADPLPTYWLTVLPAGWRVPVPAGKTLLQAALDAGVWLPRSCRNGSCRTCMAQVVGGQVHHTMAWPGLLAEEKQDGWILPCVALADSDVVITAPGASPLMG